MFDTIHKTVERVIDQESYFEFLNTLEDRLNDAFNEYQEYIESTHIETQPKIDVTSKFFEKKIATYEMLLTNLLNKWNG